MYVRIHIPRPLPLGESRPNNKVRKKCVFLTLIFISPYYYVCKNILNFSNMQQQNYLATNSAGLLCGIWGCSSPMAMAVLMFINEPQTLFVPFHPNTFFCENYFITLIEELLEVSDNYVLI